VADDLSAAISALRYRVETSARTEKHDSARISHDYLSEILEGVELPLQRHFARLTSRVYLELVQQQTKRLGIAGSLSDDQNDVGYSFVKASPEGEVVTVTSPAPGPQIFYRSLRLMGLSRDSGRLIGLGHLKDSLLVLVRDRRLDGDLVWAQERALSRLQYLIREHEDFTGRLDMSLAEINGILAPHAGQWVHPGAVRSGPTFEIDELINDIALLIERGKTHLDIWWKGVDNCDLRTQEGRARLAEIVNEHYRLTQLAYKEVVEASFPLVAGILPFYQIIPIRHQIEVEIHARSGYTSETLHWTWLPVATFEDAGSDLAFPAQPTDPASNDPDGYRQKIDAALNRYKRRAPDVSYTWGSTRIPDFLGHGFGIDGQPHETSVLGSVAHRIKEDLEWLFRELERV
jgi:hypothetical protein